MRLCLRVLLLAIGLIGAPRHADAQSDRAASQIDEILSLVRERYVDAVPDDSLIVSARNGLLRALDPYSKYLDPEAWALLQTGVDGSLGGVGMSIESDSASNGYRIRGVFPHSPALAAGLRGGDVLLSVNDQPVAGRRILDVLGDIKGQPGSIVRVAVQRPPGKKTLQVELTRAQVEVATVRGVCRQGEAWRYTLDPNTRIAYVRITNFSANTDAAVREALAGVEREQALGLVLDLRENGGGLVKAAVGVADQFLDEGTIVTLRARGDADSVIKATPGVATHLPLVVLVNANTASASEILTASLQDNGRATVIGTRTYGKGMVQNVFPLATAKGAIKLTIASYLRPSGHPIERHVAGSDSAIGGVWPDPGQTVEIAEDDLRHWQDAFFDRDTDARLVGGLDCNAAEPRDQALDVAVAWLARHTVSATGLR